MSAIADWLEGHQLPCGIKQTLGVECPTCGMQRSIILLLRGEFWASIQMFPALIPMLAMVIMLIAHLIFKPNWGAAFLKWNFIAVVAIELVHYALKFC